MHKYDYLLGMTIKEAEEYQHKKNEPKKIIKAKKKVENKDVILVQTKQGFISKIVD